MAVIYTKRICLFLDILGFSALVKSQSCDFVYNIVQGISNELESTRLTMQQIYSEPIATTFSDCIVLSIEADESDVEQASNILVSATVKMLQETYLNQRIALVILPFLTAVKSRG
jgi:short-subunit dehydrogenase